MDSCFIKQQLVLTSMHKYVPRIHVIAASDYASLHWGMPTTINTAAFNVCSFIAVTAYAVSFHSAQVFPPGLCNSNPSRSFSEWPNDATQNRQQPVCKGIPRERAAAREEASNEREFAGRKSEKIEAEQRFQLAFISQHNGRRVPVDGIRSAGYANTAAYADDDVVARQVFQQLLYRPLGRRNNQPSASYLPAGDAASSPSPSRHPSVDGRCWPSSQPLHFRFRSETGLAAPPAFDPHDALLFHVPAWISPRGHSRSALELSSSRRQQTVLSYGVFLFILENKTKQNKQKSFGVFSCIPSSQRGMPHHTCLRSALLLIIVLFSRLLNNQKKKCRKYPLYSKLAQSDLDRVIF